MADVPVNEVVNLDAVLDALEDPTSSEVYSAVESFSATAAAASALRRSLAAGEGGGGGSQPTCEQGFGASTAIDNDATAYLTWDGGSGGSPDVLLDYTDPAAPTVIEAGTYAVSVYVETLTPMTEGGWFQADIRLGNTIQSLSSPYADGATLIAVQLSSIWKLSADAEVKVRITNHDGVGTIAFQISEAEIVKLA